MVIIYERILKLMFITKSEIEEFEDDPIEYIRA